MPALTHIDADVLEKCLEDQENGSQKRVIKTTFFEIPLIRAMMASDETFARDFKDAVTSGEWGERTLALGDVEVVYEADNFIFENQALKFHITDGTVIQIDTADDIDLYPNADILSYSIVSYSEDDAEHTSLRSKEGSPLKQVCNLPQELQAFGDFIIDEYDDEEEDGYTQFTLKLTSQKK